MHYAPVIYFKRDPYFHAPVPVTMDMPERRELRSDRTFDIYEGKTHVGSGRILPWDMRWLDVAEASERVHAAVKERNGFERAVWFGGMQKMVRASKKSGMSAPPVETTFVTLALVTFCSAGRCMIQLDSPTSRVTLITAEDEDEARMGVQGIDATEAEALSMLDAAVHFWREGAILLADDTKIGLGW